MAKRVQSQQIKAILEDTVKSMSNVEMKRTTPINGLLPVTFNKLLQGAVNLCAKKQNDRVPWNAITGYVSDYIKTSEHTNEDLARLTSTPFPLLNGRSQVEGNSKAYLQMPLFDEDSGELTSSRYTGYTLTPLGQILAKRFKDVSIKDFTGHYCILPIMLLKHHLSWAHGHKCVILPYNPRELMQLQIDMIDCKSKNITDELLQAHFKGPDLGSNYTLFMDDVSVALQFVAGTGRCKVVPFIEVNLEKGHILFVRPPYTSNTSSLISYLKKRIKERGQYNTFTVETPELSISAAGSRCMIKNIQFHATEADVLREIRDDKFIVRTFNIHIATLEKANQDSNAIEDYNINLDPNNEEELEFQLYPTSVRDVLWRCIHWEYQWKYNAFDAEFKALQEKIAFYLFLEKISREGVPEIIKAALGQKNNKGKFVEYDIIFERWGVDAVRSKKEVEKGKEEGTIAEDDLIPEGLTSQEVHYLFQKTAPYGIQLTYIMYRPNEVKGELGGMLKRHHELEELLNDENLIYSIIRDELVLEASDTSLERKSKAHFIREVGTSKPNKIKTVPKAEWDKYNLPCSIYYNYTSFVRSYGRNMNMPFDINDKNNLCFMPYTEIECTTRDKVHIFHDGVMETYMVTDIPLEGVTDIFLQGILPISEKHQMMVFTSHLITGDDGSTTLMDTRQFFVDKGGLPYGFTLDKNEIITSWCYLPNEEEYVPAEVLEKGETLPYYINLLCENGCTKMNKKIPYGLIQYPSSTVSPYECNAIYNFPPMYGTVLSCYTQHYSNNTKMYYLTYKNDLSLMQINYKKNYLKVLAEVTPDIPLFSNNFSIYYDGVYIPWIDETPFAFKADAERSKKTVLKEYIWVHNRDDVSDQLFESIYSDLRTKPLDKFYIIQSFKSELNMEYKVSQLEDWSLLDFRFKLPKVKPTDEEYLRQCDLQMEMIFNHRRDLKPRHLSYAKNYANLLKGKELEIQNENEVVDENLISIEKALELDENLIQSIHSTVQDFTSYEEEHPIGDEFNLNGSDLFEEDESDEEEVIFDSIEEDKE